MPESTCLHIQDRESGPIRVVELPWISVRIGRAAFCEVRLPEYDLADEACRLYAAGRSWHLVPVGLRSPVLVEGRPVDGAFQLRSTCRSRRLLLLDAAAQTVPPSRIGRCTKGPHCVSSINPCRC